MSSTQAPAAHASHARLGRLLRPVRAGDRHSIVHAPALTTAGTLTLTSPAFEPDAPIPARHAGIGVGQNISPELGWSGLPAGTRQLLLVIEDTDAPLRRPLLHTVVLFAPEAFAATDGPEHGTIPEGDLVASDYRLTFVPASFHRTGYAGPRPVRGHGPHHYGFHLYALDRVLDPPPASVSQLLARVTGSVLGASHLVGTYERR